MLEIFSISFMKDVILYTFFYVFFRYGFNEYTEYNFRVRLELQDSFEEKLGYPIYKLFKNEICEEIENDRVKKVVRFWK